MKNTMTTIESSLPTVSKVYAPLDFVGNTFGKYFDYKRETAMIEHETKKVKAQAKIMGKQIDAQLKKELDTNNKQFKKEMKRLNTIAKDLKNSAKAKKKLLKQIDKYMNMLSDNSISAEFRLTIPTLILKTNELLAQESDQAIQKLNMMSHFDPNTKLIGE